MRTTDPLGNSTLGDPAAYTATATAGTMTGTTGWCSSANREPLALGARAGRSFGGRRQRRRAL